jgi:S1-C subfamily serine protease
VRRGFSYFGLIIILLMGCRTPEAKIECIAPTPPPSPNSTPLESTETASQETASAGTRRMRKVATATRHATVAIHNHARGVRGTGTYFEFEDRTLIITAAHVVNGTDIVEVTTPSGESASALIVLFDNRIPNDLAVLVLKEPLVTRIPMGLKLRDLTSSLIGEQLVYTGHPGGHSQMTIFGNVSGFENGSIILHSYTWLGASGSAVFDDKGRLVGILKAVDINRNPHSPYPQITEDIVWLAPATGIGLERIRILLSIYEMMNELYEEEGM